MSEILFPRTPYRIVTQKKKKKIIKYKCKLTDSNKNDYPKKSNGNKLFIFITIKNEEKIAA